MMHDNDAHSLDADTLSEVETTLVFRARSDARNAASLSLSIDDLATSRVAFVTYAESKVQSSSLPISQQSFLYWSYIEAYAGERRLMAKEQSS